MNEIINLDNVKFPSVNHKMGYNPKTKQFFNNKDYSDFKELIKTSAAKIKIEPPYKMLVEMGTVVDYDNCLKPINDGIAAAGVIDNDKNIVSVRIEKEIFKRNQPGYLRVYIGHYVD